MRGAATGIGSSVMNKAAAGAALGDGGDDDAGADQDRDGRDNLPYESRIHCGGPTNLRG